MQYPCDISRPPSHSTQNRYFISRPWGWDMWYLLWIVYATSIAVHFAWAKWFRVQWTTYFGNINRHRCQLLHPNLPHQCPFIRDFTSNEKLISKPPMHARSRAYRQNILSAKLFQLRVTSRVNCPNFYLTPIWPGCPQQGCYQCHQSIVLGSLWWRLWSTAVG